MAILPRFGFLVRTTNWLMKIKIQIVCQDMEMQEWVVIRCITKVDVYWVVREAGCTCI